MQVTTVAKVLSSQLNQTILTLLAEHDMDAVETFCKLGDQSPVYRQSVNKALESLRKAGLVKKYYNENKKKLCYSLLKKSVSINLEKMEIE
jgi:hypothetical protein